MTFEKLKELIEKNKIPNNVKLLGDSDDLWMADKTEMNWVFYNEKENHVIFTQEFKWEYLINKDYKMLD